MTIKRIDATPVTVISLAAALANAANTYTGLTGITMIELDNSTNLYPKAKAVLEVPDTFAAAPTAGSAIYLYMVRNDIDSTSDGTPVPAATDIDNLADLVGSFVVDNQDVAYRREIVISLEGVEKANFFIKNSCGQALSYATNPITVKITPFSHQDV